MGAFQKEEMAPMEELSLENAPKQFGRKLATDHGSHQVRNQSVTTQYFGELIEVKPENSNRSCATLRFFYFN